MTSVLLSIVSKGNTALLLCVLIFRKEVVELSVGKCFERGWVGRCRGTGAINLPRELKAGCKQIAADPVGVV